MCIHCAKDQEEIRERFKLIKATKKRKSVYVLSERDTFGTLGHRALDRTISFFLKKG